MIIAQYEQIFFCVCACSQEGDYIIKYFICFPSINSIKMQHFCLDPVSLNLKEILDDDILVSG